MIFAVGFSIGIILGFLIFALDWPEIYVCIRVGGWKFQQGKLFRLTRRCNHDGRISWQTWVQIWPKKIV